MMCARERFGLLLGSLVATTALSMPALAQQPRAPVVITDEPAWGSGYVATAGDTSVAVWRSEDSESIYVSTSDGTGLEWSPPQRADDSLTDAVKTSPRAIVLGEKVLVFWNAQVFSPVIHWYVSQIYYNVLDMETGRWEGERWLSLVGDDPTLSSAGALEIASSSHQGVEYVYVLTSLGLPPVFKSNEGCLVLTVSTDAGSNFAPPIRLSEVGSNPGSIELAADEGSVYVASVQEDPEDTYRNAFFTVSHQAGAPGSFLDPPLKLNAGFPSKDDVEAVFMAAARGTVVTAWQECIEPICLWGQPVRTRVSTDGGATFANAVTLTSTAGPVNVQTAIDTTTENVLVSHHFDDGVWGAHRLWASTDGGTTFAQVLDQVPSFGLTTTEGPDANGLVVRTWSEVVDTGLGDGEYDYVIHMSLSQDGGLTWGDTSTFESEEVGFPKAYNALYDNFISTWRDYGGDAEHLLAGGFRAPTLIPHGWSAGPTTAHFELDLFDPELDPLALVVLSTEIGDLLLPDGRSLGLALTPLLPLSFQAGAAGLLSATIGPDGSGATPEVDVDLPPGLTIHAVGLGLDPESATAGHITDAVALDT